MIRIALIAALVAGGSYALHRLALWMERRGWLYYRERKASPSTLGSALLELHSLVEPEAKVVLEMREEEHRRSPESGAPPIPPAGDGGGGDATR